MRNFDETYKRMYEKYNKRLDKLRIKSYVCAIIFGIILFMVYQWAFSELMLKQKNFLIISIVIICFCIYKISLKGKTTKLFKNEVINEFVKEYDKRIKL